MNMCERLNTICRILVSHHSVLAEQRQLSYPRPPDEMDHFREIAEVRVVDVKPKTILGCCKSKPVSAHPHACCKKDLPKLCSTACTTTGSVATAIKTEVRQ
jgi:hypothetical protein